MVIKDVVERNIIIFILVGNEGKIREILKEIGFDLSGIKIVDKDDIKECVEIVVKLVLSKEVDFVMKGLLDIFVILKEVLNKDYGFRIDSLLSYVMVYELEKYYKLFIIIDGGMNIVFDYE